VHSSFLVVITFFCLIFSSAIIWESKQNDEFNSDYTFNFEIISAKAKSRQRCYEYVLMLSRTVSTRNIFCDVWNGKILKKSRTDILNSSIGYSYFGWNNLSHRITNQIFLRNRYTNMVSNWMDSRIPECQCELWWWNARFMDTQTFYLLDFVLR
jgi:hypothetical protein